MIKQKQTIFNMIMMIMIIDIVATLHLSTADDAQLQYLINLQKSYQSELKKLNDYSANIRAQVVSTNDLNAKITVLQQAISKQRESLYQIKYNLIPSSLDPAVKCQVISNEDKQLYTQKLGTIRTQTQDFQEILKLIPECDEKTAIEAELKKFKDYIERTQLVIDNNCEQILEKSPHLYQSNLQVQNWVIGDGKTMDDLIKEYIDRAQKHSNISNCASNTPFFNGKQCIECSGDNNIFDLTRKICIQCPDEWSLNKTSHQCERMPKNSNFTAGQNYILKPLKLMPLPNQNLSYCQPEAPFFNGTECVKCPLPNHYWNISESKCIECSNQQVFNLNNKKCVQRAYNKLTKLQNTAWVTTHGNITKVLEERLNILILNETSGQYHLCPSLEPFYDDISCVFCEHQFNLETKKCTSPPEGKKYDKNMRKYLVPEESKEMYENATKYITQRGQIANSQDIENCNATHPFYDQVSCIYCQKPFPIFNYDENSCVACSPTEIFNETSHKCVQRQYVYVKGNETNLLETDQVTVDDYKTKLYDSIAKNPDKIPVQCTNEEQYAAIDKCLVCENRTYFNIETFKCEKCDGRYNPETKKCNERLYYLTNLDAKNIIFENQTKAKQQQKVAQELERRQICPLQTPFETINETECQTCPDDKPYFQYETKQCVNCPKGTIYDAKAKYCRQIVYLTNLSANILVEDPYTIQKYINDQEQLKLKNLTEVCPPDQPFTSDHKLCSECLETFPLFNMSSGLCTQCPRSLKYFNTTRKCEKVNYLTDLEAERILVDKNYTIQNVNLSQQAIIAEEKMHEQCTTDQPFGSDAGCINCIESNTYFNLSSRLCQYCPKGTRYWKATRTCKQILMITNIPAAEKLVVSDDHTFQSLSEHNKKLSLEGPTQECPEDMPYKSPQKCIGCPEEKPYFFLETLTCQQCNNFKPQNLTCPPKPDRYPNLMKYRWVSHDYDADTVIKQYLRLKSIPGATECYSFYNRETKQCVNCTKQTWVFNYDTNQCQPCGSNQQFDINNHKCMTVRGDYEYFTNLQGTNKHYLIYGGLTYGELEAQIEQIKDQNPSAMSCTDDHPYYDKFGCISCPKYKQYFNLRYKLCQVCLFNEDFNINTHNCVDENGAAVWRKPSGQLVYPFLFGDQQDKEEQQAELAEQGK